jgi:hypothetical protein
MASKPHLAPESGPYARTSFCGGPGRFVTMRELGDKREAASSRVLAEFCPACQATARFKRAAYARRWYVAASEHKFQLTMKQARSLQAPVAESKEK